MCYHCATGYPKYSTYLPLHTSPNNTRQCSGDGKLLVDPQFCSSIENQSNNLVTVLLIMHLQCGMGS